MHGDFFDAFGKEEKKNRSIPKGVLDALNKTLPPNYVYVRMKDGSYKPLPNPKVNLNNWVINSAFDFEKEPKLGELYTKLGAENFLEYLFRAQKAVPCKEIRIGTDEMQVPLEKLSSDPFDDRECIITQTMMYPSRYEKAQKVIFESPEGDKSVIHIQQVKYDSLTEIKRENVDFPALRIEIYQYSPLTEIDEPKAFTSREHQIRINYAVFPNKAKSSKEAVKALRIFRGLINGETKINGEKLIGESTIKQEVPVQVENSLVFWETAEKLEDKIGITFDLSLEITQEDVKLLTELDICMLQGKMLEWKHPFDHFHISGFHSVSGDKSFNDFVGNQNLQYVFIEGPIKGKLLGAEFDIYSKTLLSGFVITNIEWSKEDEGEVYISDNDRGPWILSRLYCTKEEAIILGKEIQNRNLLQSRSLDVARDDSVK